MGGVFELCECFLVNPLFDVIFGPTCQQAAWLNSYFREKPFIEDRPAPIFMMNAIRAISP